MTPELLDKIAEIKRIAKIIGEDYRHTETIIDICEQIELDYQIEKRLENEQRDEIES